MAAQKWRRRNDGVRIGGGKMTARICQNDGGRIDGEQNDGAELELSTFFLFVFSPRPLSG